MLIKLLVGLAVIGCLVGLLIWQMSSPQPKIAMNASAQQIQQILSDELPQLHGKIPVNPIELSLPTDGKGLRILARVEKGMSDQVPAEISVILNAQEFIVKIEVEESYESYQAQ